MFFWQALQLHCNRVVKSCSNSTEVGWTILTAVTGLLGSAASLRSVQVLISFVSKSLHLELVYSICSLEQFQKKSQRRRKKKGTLPPEQIKIIKWVVLWNWDWLAAAVWRWTTSSHTLSSWHALLGHWEQVLLGLECKEIMFKIWGRSLWAWWQLNAGVG